MDAVEVAEGRASKRQRIENNQQPSKRTASNLFAPFRTVGLVSPTAVGFTSVPLGKTTFQITTSTERSLQTYDLRRGLNLVFITRPQTPGKITATAAWREKVFAAWASNTAQGVWVFARGKKTADLRTPDALADPVKRIIVFGAWIVSCCSTRLDVWHSTTQKHHKTILTEAHIAYTGAICSVATQLNKVLVGCANGSVQLWNVSTGRLIFTIHPAIPSSGPAITLQPTLALNIIAISYANGTVALHDVRSDRLILSFSAGTKATPVTSISFRSDGLGAGVDGQKDGVMATASSHSGDIALWDLNKQGRKMGVLRGAHNPPVEGKVSGGISGIEFLAGQAILVSSGLDNTLKTWIFDHTPFNPIPRILHSRGGHAAPVRTLHFLPSDFDGADAGGKWLLSGSLDRSLWTWSLRRDGQSSEMSQGAVRKRAKKKGLLSNGLGEALSRNAHVRLEDLKVPPVVCMACSLNRDGGIGAMPGERNIWNNGKDSTNKKRGTNSTELSATTGWESVLTGHDGDKIARTWFWGRRRAGRWAFETGDGGNVTAVAMSSCGTFALVGSSNGGIDMFNMQSGIYRQRFPARLTAVQAKRLISQRSGNSNNADNSSQARPRGVGKHTKAVTGIAVDNINQAVISCGLDGKIKFWDFASGTLLKELDWSPVTSIRGLELHRSSDLLALSCADGCLRIIDITTTKLVRELWGCESDIADFSFSVDGRWLMATSADGADPVHRSTVRVWDLPTSHLIDAFRLRSHCSALAFSNTGEYLATASSDGMGIDIWTNRTLFAPISTRRIALNDVADLDCIPTASGEGGSGALDAAFEGELVDGNADDEEVVPAPDIDQLSEELVTLSLVPKAQWQTLLHLDIIRERNKPIEPPKQPEKAPFFLPSLQDHGSSRKPAATAPEVDTVSVTANGTNSKLSKATTLSRTSGRDEFSKLIQSASESPSVTHFEGMTHYLVSMSPAAADLAIRNLDPSPPYTELTTFIDALTDRMKAKRDFELIVVWMSVWVKCHGSLLVSGDGTMDPVRMALARWRAEAQTENKRLGTLIGLVEGVLGWVRDAD